MICGIGVDIADVAKVGESIKRYGDRYLNKVFTPGEIEYCRNVPISNQRYAARFAAKEAAMKALSTGCTEEVSWKNFEVINEPSGQPTLRANGGALELLTELEVSRTWLSLTHNPEYAIAYVVFEQA